MAIKLEVKNLYKIFGEHPKQAFELLKQGLDKEHIFEKTGATVGVQDANLAIEEGEIFVIMGLSGSGKSTLVRLLNRLIEPTRGQVLIDGEDIAVISDQALREVRRKKISMVFQSFALMPHMSVIDNTAFGLELAGMSKAERHERALDALKQVNLEQWANSYPDELSGGMRQRVGIAMAMTFNPELLLADEPTSALDVTTQAQIVRQMMELRDDFGTGIIIVTHNIGVAAYMADQLIVMHHGKVVDHGTREEVLNNPTSDYTKKLLEAVPEMEGKRYV